MRGFSVKLSCWSGVHGIYDVRPSVLMDDQGVGTFIVFLVGNRC